MSTIHLHQRTTSQYVAGLTDFGPVRSKLFGYSAGQLAEAARSRPEAGRRPGLVDRRSQT